MNYIPIEGVGTTANPLPSSHPCGQVFDIRWAGGLNRGAWSVVEGLEMLNKSRFWVYLLASSTCVLSYCIPEIWRCHAKSLACREDKEMVMVWDVQR